MTSTSPSTPPAPRRHRLALLVLLGVYPILTLLLYALAPLTRAWDIWQRNLLVTPIMVMMIVYGLIPMIQKRFRRFLTATS